MNIFNFCPAHDNSIVKLSNWLDRLKIKKRRSGIIILVSLLVKLVIAGLPILFSLQRIISVCIGKIFSAKKLQIDKITNKEISVVIVNWQGKHLLQSLFEHLYSALKAVEGNHEIIFVDNGSTDGSVDYVKENFKDIKVIALKRNFGFSAGNNIGVKEASKDLVMFLNTDMHLNKDTLPQLLTHFDDPYTFAVSPKVYFNDGRLNEGHSWSKFQNGMLMFYNERQFNNAVPVKSPAVTLYPHGGCMLFNKKIFYNLGGLDEIFSPFCWEDDDIGYRALKRGYKVFYEPQVTAIHAHQASMNKIPSSYVNAIKEKNMHIFFLKNITDKDYLERYLLTLKKNLNAALQRKDYSTILSFFLIALQLPEILLKRIVEHKHIKHSDRQIAIKTNNEGKKSRIKGKKPTVLIVTPFLPYPLTHGSAVRICNLVKNANDDFDFILLSFITSRAQLAYKQDLLKLFKEVYMISGHTPFESNLKPYEKPKDWKHCISQQMVTELQKVTNKHDVDIVHIKLTEMIYYVSQVFNSPVVFSEYDVGPLMYGRSFIRPEKGIEKYLSPLRKINYVSKYIKKYNRAIALTGKDYAILSAFFPKVPLTVVETGVDAEKYSYKYSNKGKNLVYLGHYGHYPNEDAACWFVEKIFPMIKEKEKDVHLYLVGSHPKRRVNKFREREDITVTGTVDDVGQWLEKATCFIAPIRLGCGIKGKVLEALSMGLPTVATTLASEGLNIEDGKEMLIADKEEEFAEKTLKLLADENLRKEVSLNARKFVEDKFSWPVFAKKLKNMYKKVLDEVNI